VYVSHIWHVIGIFSFCTVYKTSVSTGVAKQIMPILRIICYNGSLITWTVVSMTTAKFKLLLFSMSIFDLSYTSNMLILMILYGFCLLHAQFCYIIVYIRKTESRVKITDWDLAAAFWEHNPLYRLLHIYILYNVGDRTEPVTPLLVYLLAQTFHLRPKLRIFSEKEKT
jgi:hypothetical protein